MARPRDNQRSKVYKAEKVAFKWATHEEEDTYYSPEFETVQECEEFIAKLTRSRWWKTKRYNLLCHGDRIRVTDGRGRRRGGASSGTYGGGRIMLPRPTRNRWYILHELAHLITTQQSRGIGGRPVASHGPEFVKVYLGLAQRWLEPEEYQALRAAFKDHRVKYRVRN